MNSLRIARFLALVALAPVAAFAGPPANHHEKPETVTGIYALTFNLAIDSALPVNSTITCGVRIVPAFPNAAFPAGPVETAASVATVTGSTAVCTVQIPFSWTVTNSSAAALDFEIKAFSASGSIPVLVRSSAVNGVSEPYPQPGGTENISFNVTL